MASKHKLKFHVRSGQIKIGVLIALFFVGVVIGVGLTRPDHQAKASVYPTSELPPDNTPPPRSFFPGPMTLTVTAPLGGTVVSSPGGISCPGTCSANFVLGTTVTLINSDSDGYTFDHWSGACGGNAGCTVTLVDNYFTTVTPNYISDVIVVVTGPGTVTSDLPGISCGLTCTSPYPNNTVVTLTATPDPGKYFYGWTGDCEGTDPCTVTMTKPMHLGAWFGDPGTMELMVVNLPAAGIAAPGGIYSSPSGISCLNDSFHGMYGCMAFFPENSFVTLTGGPQPGKYFTDWSGDAATCGQNPFGCQVVMTGTQFVGGGFGAIPTHFISVGLGSPGVVATGSVTSSPPGISCVNDVFHGVLGCIAGFYQFSTSTYPYPTTQVTLTAGPSPDHFFLGWSGNCEAFGANPNCTLTMNDDYFVGGGFARQAKLVLNVHKDPNFPGGTVTTDQPGDPSCTAELQCIYRYNLLSPATVTLTAVPDVGSVWRWRIYCEPAGHNPTCAFNMGTGETQTVDIYFFPELVLNVGGAGLGYMEISPPDSRGVTSCTAGSTCLVTYLSPTSVTMTAHPVGNAAYSWGQACGGSVETCMLNVAPGEQFGDSFTVDLNFYPNMAAMKKALDSAKKTTDTNTAPANTNTAPTTNTNTTRTRTGIIE